MVTETLATGVCDIESNGNREGFVLHNGGDCYPSIRVLTTEHSCLNKIRYKCVHLSVTEFAEKYRVRYENVLFYGDHCTTQTSYSKTDNSKHRTCNHHEHRQYRRTKH